MLGELTGEEQPDSGLDLPGGDGGPLVVVRQLGGLGGDPLEDIVDEGVHDGHGLGGDAGVRVNLLKNLVDVDAVRLLSLRRLLLLLVRGLRNEWLGIGILALLAALGRFTFGRHFLR